MHVLYMYKFLSFIFYFLYICCIHEILIIDLYILNVFLNNSFYIIVQYKYIILKLLLVSYEIFTDTYYIQKMKMIISRI